MSTNTIAVIGVAAIGLLLLAVVLVWLGHRARKHQHHNNAENIRGEAAEETLRVRQREALADETAAGGRAAQAEADVTEAPQAAGLQQQSAAHRSDAATSRDQLNQQWDRAEKLDPAASTDETPGPIRREPQSL